jgi:hypothetical protein
MASNFFQNNTVDINQIWFSSHKKLIKRVLTETGQLDKYDELVQKFLGDQLKIKKQRDPLMPKRPKSSFLYFCETHRNDIRKEHPAYKMGDVMKELGKMWRECEDKEQYNKMSSDAKTDYEENIEEYNNNNCYE